MIAFRKAHVAPCFAFIGLNPEAPEYGLKRSHRSEAAEVYSGAGPIEDQRLEFIGPNRAGRSVLI